MDCQCVKTDDCKIHTILDRMKDLNYSYSKYHKLYRRNRKKEMWDNFYERYSQKFKTLQDELEVLFPKYREHIYYDYYPQLRLNNFPS